MNQTQNKFIRYESVSANFILSQTHGANDRSDESA